MTTKKEDLKVKCEITDNVIHVNKKSTTVHHWGRKRTKKLSDEIDTAEYLEALYRATSEGRDLQDCLND